MRDYNKRIFISLFWVVLGVILIALEIMGKIDDFWSGMGAGFIGVGIVQIIRYARYKKDDQYKEKVDTANKDERNRFIANKAWAWAGYLYVLIAAIATIVFQILGKRELSTFAGFSVCVIMVFHWLSYLYLQQKY